MARGWDENAGVGQRSQDDDDGEDPTGVDSLRDEGPELGHLKPVGAFGHYEILGRLGAGGMSEIFLARDSLGDAKVKHLAIKCLTEELEEDANSVVMFLDEARLANRLYHPNVCHVYESGEIDGMHYMAMEWVHGPSLRRLIRRAAQTRPVPIPIAVRILVQVARALDYVHGARGEGDKPLNIVHRDVTPQNIVIGWNGTVKLLDFGIAKSAAQYARTRAGVVKGKYAYMSPEQWQSERLDKRTDVFALGICLYELLTLRPLFHRESVVATLSAVTTEQQAPLHEVDAAIPRELSDVVERALAKDPLDRWESAGAMEDALDQLSQRQGASVTAPDIAAFLSTIFTEEDMSPLPRPTRQTGSHLSGVLGGVDPFGKADPMTPPSVPSLISSRPPPPVVSAPAPPGRATLPWLPFVLTVIASAAVTGGIIWLLG